MLQIAILIIEYLAKIFLYYYQNQAYQFQFQLKKTIQLLSKLFNNTNRKIDNSNNNSNIFLLSNLLSKLPANIISYNPSNPLLKSNNQKLCKIKKSTMFTLRDLSDLSYNINESASVLSQKFFIISEKIIDDIDNS